MAITNNHKLTLLYMMKILLERTDEEHRLNASELIRCLSAYGCEAERRTIYSNAAILEDFGIDIIGGEGRDSGYYIGSREFELPELKLLVDAVQSSKFITVKKSEELIGKLMKQINVQKAKQLNRSVFIGNRTKTGNEKVYYNVDALHSAMNGDHQIRFQYGEWNREKKLVAKKDGRIYQVSPWALTWNDENYYLIAYDELDEKIKHFRVDKMLKIEETGEARNGRDQFKGFDLAAFSKKTFGMFGGREEDVMLRCKNSLAGVIIDRFGKETMLIPEGAEHFRVHMPIAVSPQFFGWVTGLGDGIEILAPDEVREEYLAYLEKIRGVYGK